jgi:hypothetical protein
MPNIEITQEQAAALARGENVTLTPKRRESTYFIQFSAGNAYKVTTTKELPEGVGTPAFTLRESDGDVIEQLRGPGARPDGTRERLVAGSSYQRTAIIRYGY